jgi:hypothetical protein
MKHRITGNKIEIVVNENILTDIRDCCRDGTIDYNKAVRKSLVFEGVFKYHAMYPDNVRNLYLCPLLDLLIQDLNGSVILKEYL